jgi:uncharacterized protein (TIGR04255 family)
VYKNPPFIEAVCEFRFEPGEPWYMVPGLFYEQVKDDFSTHKQIRGLTISPESQEANIDTRIRFLDKAEQAFFQIGHDLLAINHLRPYPTWNRFAPMIQKGFNIYRNVAKPTAINRIGLRYINRISVPEERLELSDYFNYYPEVGESLPGNLHRFHLETHTLYENQQDILKTVLKSVVNEEGNALLLDFDYFLIQPGVIPLDDAMKWVNEAHNHIKQAFEGCITDKLRQRFEEEED